MRDGEEAKGIHLQYTNDIICNMDRKITARPILVSPKSESSSLGDLPPKNQLISGRYEYIEPSNMLRADYSAVSAALWGVYRR